MKKLILPLSIVAGVVLTGCGDSGTSSGSGMACNVSRSGNSVSIYSAYMGGTYSATSSITSETIISHHSVYGFSTQAEADEFCTEQRHEAAQWKDGSYKVSCSGLSVTVDDFSEYDSMDEGGLSEVEAEYNQICANMSNRINRGEMDGGEEDY